MIFRLLGGKCVIKFEGPVVTIYIFFHLKCLTCVLTKTCLQQRKALILTLPVWGGRRLALSTGYRWTCVLGTCADTSSERSVDIYFFLSALALVVLVQPRDRKILKESQWRFLSLESTLVSSRIFWNVLNHWFIKYSRMETRGKTHLLNYPGILLHTSVCRLSVKSSPPHLPPKKREM